MEKTVLTMSFLRRLFHKTRITVKLGSSGYLSLDSVSQKE